VHIPNTKEINNYDLSSDTRGPSGFSGERDRLDNKTKQTILLIGKFGG
jgi:hypothetical protein